MSKSEDVVGGLTVLILGAGALWWWMGDDDEPAPVAEAQVAVEPIDTTCIVSAAGGDALVFPTEAGLDAFAVAANRRVAEEATARHHGAFEVAAGTTCERVDLGLLQTQILITAGPHEGRTGWVPTEWTRR